MLPTELFLFNKELYYQLHDGSAVAITAQSDIIPGVVDIIEKFYPRAYLALCEIYEKSKPNLTYFRYLIVKRFCKCNFGNIDDIPDIVERTCNFECVPCPLKGECKYEGVICHPIFNHRISDAEMRVLNLIYSNTTREDIAQCLSLSLHTVNNHIRNAYTRIGVKDTPAFIRYASQNNLFPCTNNTK